MNYIEMIRQGNTKGFYNLGVWRKLRLKALERDKYECQICKYRVRNKVVKADCVHHIKEIKHHPELALELTNLQSLCRECHERVHDRNENNRNKPKFVTEERW